MPWTAELCHPHHSRKPFQVLKVLRVQDPATLTFRYLDLHGTGKLAGAEVSGVGTSAKDGENHSASLKKFLLLSKRNEKKSRLGQKFKDRLAESYFPLSAFCDTCYTRRNCCYSDLIAFSYSHMGTSSSTRQQKTGPMTGRKTYWQKCSGTRFHLPVAPTAPAHSISFRFKPQRISHLISDQPPHFCSKPRSQCQTLPIHGSVCVGKGWQAWLDNQISKPEAGKPYPRLLVTLE